MFDVLLVDANARVKVRYRDGEANVPKVVYDDVERVSQAFGGIPAIMLWDHPEAKLARRAWHPDYKIKRERDEAAEAAVRETVEYLKGKLPYWYDPRYEADDLFAAIIKAYPNNSQVIYSLDKDMHPLLAGPGSRIQLTRTSGMTSRWQAVTAQDVEARRGIKLCQWYEFLALAGDSSDGIGGVPSIGEKTAVSILQQCETVEEAVGRVDELGLSPARRDSLVRAYQDGTFALMLRLVSPIAVESIPRRIVETLESSFGRGFLQRYNVTLESLNRDLDQIATPPPPPPPF